MSARRKLIAGNWKMNGLQADGVSLARAIAARAGSHAGADEPACEILVCPPATLIDRVREAMGDAPVAIGGQDCHTATSGAHTGDISAQMLADLGCRYVIVGHSERRQDHREDDALVKAKAEAALSAGLRPIVCVGETEAERDAGQAVEVVRRQVRESLPDGGAASEVVIAYEPVWAIGTGRTPTLEDVREMHEALRAQLSEQLDGAGAVRLLYGGSVKPGNARDLLAVDDVDGALVGGASLKSDDFWQIVEAV